MAGYPLAQLLAARRFREDEAARIAREAAAALEEARRLEVEALEKWKHHQKWRPGEEARLFERIKGKEIPQSGLDCHREDILALRDEENRLEQCWRDAVKAVAEAEDKAEQTRRAQLDAVRDRQKIEEHRERWRREENARQEAKEEAELEDFPFRTSPDEN